MTTSPAGSPAFSVLGARRVRAATASRAAIAVPELPDDIGTQRTACGEFARIDVVR